MADSINEFGAMLRSWRDRASPEEFGLPIAARRRARGLRRQELARLAGVSPTTSSSSNRAGRARRRPRS
ncbi:MAG TPA: hypothetical protein VG253_05345 [Streptosporangiaceae bacterium]|nr:hypothetical protein [Streptosporangiaceae bacterium]